MVEKVSVQTEIGAKMEVTKEDLAAIQVSKIETELLNLQAKTDAEVKSLRHEITKGMKDLKEMAGSRIRKPYTQKVAGLKRSLKLLGFEAEVRLNVNFSFDLNGDGKPTASVDIRIGGRQYNDVSVSHQVEATAQEKAAVSSLAAKSKKVDRLISEGVEIRRRLSQMDTIERQARAKIAEYALNQSPNGRELVKRIGSIAGLPALPSGK